MNNKQEIRDKKVALIINSIEEKDFDAMSELTDWLISRKDCDDILQEVLSKAVSDDKYILFSYLMNAVSRIAFEKHETPSMPFVISFTAGLAKVTEEKAIKKGLLTHGFDSRVIAEVIAKSNVMMHTTDSVMFLPALYTLDEISSIDFWKRMNDGVFNHDTCPLPEVTRFKAPFKMDQTVHQEFFIVGYVINDGSMIEEAVENEAINEKAVKDMMAFFEYPLKINQLNPILSKHFYHEINKGIFTMLNDFWYEQLGEKHYLLKINVNPMKNIEQTIYDAKVSQMLDVIMGVLNQWKDEKHKTLLFDLAFDRQGFVTQAYLAVSEFDGSDTGEVLSLVDFKLHELIDLGEVDGLIKKMLFYISSVTHMGYFYHLTDKVNGRFDKTLIDASIVQKEGHYVVH